LGKTILKKEINVDDKIGFSLEKVKYDSLELGFYVIIFIKISSYLQILEFFGDIITSEPKGLSLYFHIQQKKQQKN
jgi:hypothetical protein